MKKTNAPKLKILMIGAEVWPYASVGGLSRVLHHLPTALLEMEVDVRVFMPKYGKIDTQKFEMKVEKLNIKFPFEDFNKDVLCNVLYIKPEKGPQVYFLENQEYYELRANEYGYVDDHIRWGLLQRGMWEFLRNSDWVPDIIHCHDWQTGLIPNLYIEDYHKEEKLKNIKTIFTMHSLRYQAAYDHMFVTEIDFDDGKSKIPPIISKEFERLNSVKRGILYADALTTVSPTYAKEILTKEVGENLDRLLNEVRFKLSGILNGIDYSEYNTETDLNLHRNYSVGEWDKRAENKTFLQDRFMLKKDLDAPMFGISYRLVEQKGIPIINEIIETILSEYNAQLIVNGDGETAFKSYFRYLSEKYPDQVGVNLSYDDKLPRLIFAGCDFLLHPSRFEPCGIVQLEAMRYGCIPIAREVGGLADTVFEGKNGFTFKNYNSQSLLMTLARAIEVFKHKDLLNKLKENAMKMDYSWNKSAKEYLKIYKNIVKESV